MRLCSVEPLNLHYSFVPPMLCEKILAFFRTLRKYEDMRRENGESERSLNWVAFEFEMSYFNSLAFWFLGCMNILLEVYFVFQGKLDMHLYP